MGVKRTSGWRALSFICVLSASRGHAGERAFHLLLNALNGAGADAALARDLANAFAATQARFDAPFKSGIDLRSAERFAPCDRALEASVDPLADHCPARTMKKALELPDVLFFDANAQIPLRISKIVMQSRKRIGSFFPVDLTR